MALTGSCFCGAVRYRIEGGVRAARSCHCSRCRKAFSAQASAYAEVDPETFSWTAGEELLTAYVGQHGAGKLFCKVCGSTLAGVFGGTIHGVTLGCLNEDPGVQIEAHIFVGSKAPWEVVPEGAPCYEGAPPPGVLG